jgi:hypothetical protein
MNVEFTDRYEAMGIPYTNPETMCDGDCEGTGFVPIKADDNELIYRELWQKAEKENPVDDGWHFVKCPKCNGTGKLTPPSADEL